ncbi:MAG: NAD(+) diphosphatase [Micropruina sp.]|nr:NAD(+) diphosphatase [Micropruina sp.]
MHSWISPGHLDRVEGLRNDPDWIAGLWTDPGATVLTVAPTGDLACLPNRTSLRFSSPSGAYDPELHLLVGLAAQRPCFAVLAEAVGQAASLRDLAPHLDGTDTELATAALALVNWHRVAPRCGACGSPTVVTAGGYTRHCARCGRDRFPRTDPAVIVAVLDDDERLLLGRHAAWPTGRLSLLAGFVSAGESLEQAVHREIGEEVGVALTQVRYLASQPWPFPRSLMLGFVARAASTLIRVDGIEIVAAQWFSRPELADAVASGEVSLPGPASIAHRIIADWQSGALSDPFA